MQLIISLLLMAQMPCTSGSCPRPSYSTPAPTYSAPTYSAPTYSASAYSYTQSYSYTQTYYSSPSCSKKNLKFGKRKCR